MIEIGKYQLLEVAREVDFGLYLTDGEKEVLLPGKYVPRGIAVGDKLRVFVYNDSEDRPVATTLNPSGQVGDVIALRVTDTTPHGAFLEWGLEKDLFVPKREQHQRFEQGNVYLVKILLDHKTNRLIATGKLKPFLSTDYSSLTEGQQVQLQIWQNTDLGYKAVIEGAYEGLLYRHESAPGIQIGDEFTGFIHKIRSDGKIDLRLNTGGNEGAELHRDALLELIREEGGYLELTDKSPPSFIMEKTGMSKKAFKKALGNLYRERKVDIEEKGIRLKDD
jgi:predicted RNA-binding protein (virulence factor B family)